jgi:hypothetical protein
MGLSESDLSSEDFEVVSKAGMGCMDNCKKAAFTMTMKLAPMAARIANASTGRRATLLQAPTTKAPPALAARAENVRRRLRRLRTYLHRCFA